MCIGLFPKMQNFEQLTLSSAPMYALIPWWRDFSQMKTIHTMDAYGCQVHKERAGIISVP